MTLMCQGTSFYAGNLTTWFHNGSSIDTQNQPSYSFRANSNDSGSYRCQREQTSLSDPVHLDVISGQWRKALESLGEQGEMKSASTAEVFRKGQLPTYWRARL